MSPTPTPQTITLAGGCFWCLEAVYERVRGVLAVESGYSNGQAERPNYEQVCGGDTGCAEVVRVRFDPAQIGLRDLLEIFFVVHDPTTLNRQGNDVGTQYRSVIFYHSPAQQAVAQQVIQEFNKADLWGRPLVTEVTPAPAFYAAEEYHQEYFARNPYQGYCRVVIAPKVAKFRQKYAQRLRVS